MIIFHNYSGAFEPAKPSRLTFIGKPPELPPVTDITGEVVEEGAAEGDAAKQAEDREAGTEAAGVAEVDKTIKPLKGIPLVTPEVPDLPRVEEKEEKIVQSPDTTAEAEAFFQKKADKIEAKKRGGQLDAEARQEYKAEQARLQAEAAAKAKAEAEAGSEG